MAVQSGGTGRVRSARACVVYDAESGRVHHVHQVVTFEGGREPDEHEVEAHALALVRKRGFHAGNLMVLHVAHDAIQPRTLYAVDVRTRSLVIKERL
jgi:hypothetical protein